MAFESRASNLVPADTNEGSDIFVHDRVAGTTTRVSISSTGEEAQATHLLEESISFEPVISADGRFVAFSSIAYNLVPGDDNDATDIFVRDLVAHTTSRVSVTSSGKGVPAEGEGSYLHYAPAISADGRFVAFSSDASKLVPEDTNEVGDVFVRDTVAGTTTRVSVTWKGEQANSSSIPGAISADGRYVAFYSEATNLNRRGDTNGVNDVFVRDRIARTTTRISVTWDGQEANAASYDPDISADGRYVAFASMATNLNRRGDKRPESKGLDDVFVRDRVAHTTTLVSVSWKEEQADFLSGDPDISADGRFVAFDSEATNLNRRGDTNRRNDVFIRDRVARTTARVSVTWKGRQAKGHSEFPAISARGRFVAFASSAPDLVKGDTNKTGDVFLRGPRS